MFRAVIFSIVTLSGRSYRDRLVSVLGCGMFLCSCKRDEASGRSLEAKEVFSESMSLGSAYIQRVPSQSDF